MKRVTTLLVLSTLVLTGCIEQSSDSNSEQDTAAGQDSDSPFLVITTEDTSNGSSNDFPIAGSVDDVQDDDNPAMDTQDDEMLADDDQGGGFPAAGGQEDDVPAVDDQEDDSPIFFPPNDEESDLVAPATGNLNTDDLLNGDSLDTAVTGWGCFDRGPEADDELVVLFFFADGSGVLADDTEAFETSWTTSGSYIEISIDGEYIAQFDNIVINKTAGTMDLTYVFTTGQSGSLGCVLVDLEE